MPNWTLLASGSDSDRPAPATSNVAFGQNISAGAGYIILTCTSTVDAADGGLNSVSDDAGLTWVKIASTVGLNSGTQSTEDVFAAWVDRNILSTQLIRMLGFARGVSTHYGIFLVTGDGTSKLLGTDPTQLVSDTPIVAGWFDNSDTGARAISRAWTEGLGVHGCGQNASALWVPQSVSPGWTKRVALYNAANDRTHIVQTRTLPSAGSYNSAGASGYSKTWNNLFVALKLESDSGTPFPSTTGEKFPTLGEAVAEGAWADDIWVTPTNIYSDNAATANITATTFDSGDQSYVLKATGFDFSSIPDNATILGVTVRVNAWYRSGQGTGSIDLVQLLDTAKAKGGTNKAGPTVLTTVNSTVITYGSGTDLWGLALTPAWVKSSNFGVALGVLSTAANTDVDVDYITIEISYSVPAGAPARKDEFFAFI